MAPVQASRQLSPSHGPVSSPAGLLGDLAQDILVALQGFRGAAHRETVIVYVEAERRRAGRPVEPALRPALIAAFEAAVGEGPDDPRPFRLPFGPGSHRWALSERLDPRS